METTAQAKLTTLTDMSMEHYGVVVQAVTEELRALRASLVETAGTIAHTQPTSPNPIADLGAAIEEHVAAQLQAADPGTPVVSSEHRDGDTPYRYWLVKPIDSATHFVRGNPYYCCTFTLIINDAPVVGAIYNFATDQLYYAVRGHGAYRNNERMYVGRHASADAAVLMDVDTLTARNAHLQEALAAQYQLLSLLAPGHELSMIANGRADARVCIDSLESDGDLAAGALLVQEAGGVARNLTGADYQASDHDLIIASSPELYEQLCSLVVTARESMQPSALHAAM